MFQFMLNETFHKGQSFITSCQSGKISPNLVTLAETDKGKRGKIDWHSISIYVLYLCLSIFLPFL